MPAPSLLRGLGAVLLPSLYAQRGLTELAGAAGRLETGDRIQVRVIELEHLVKSNELERLHQRA